MIPTKKLLLVAIALATLITVPTALVAYTMFSNHVTGPVTQQATINLQVNGSTNNSTSYVEGTQVTLTAIVSDGTNPLVTFFNASTSIGTATAVSGTATYLYTIPIGSTGYDFSATAPHS